MTGLTLLHSVVFDSPYHSFSLIVSGELYIMLLGLADNGVPVPGIHESEARQPERPTLDRAHCRVIPHLLLLRQVSTSTALVAIQT